MSGEHVFTIPPGVPFLDTLAEALLSGRLVGDLAGGPFGLAAVTLYLPTRRAARALAAILARECGPAALLPRMVPLGEADEAELDLLSAPPGERRDEVLRPPIPALERRLILARLVQAWAGTVDRQLLPLGDEVPFRVPSSPADAIGLAADLEGLMDSLTVEGLPWDDIAGAVEAEHSRYFSLTLDFVRIAAEHWPKILAARGVADPVERGRALVLAEAARLTRERPAEPVIVAGSTGSVPATARLIAAIARLPRGAVVLPGLDRDLDAAGWAAIDPGGDGEAAAHAHPQAVLHRLVGKGFLALDRADIAPLGSPDAAAAARAALLSQALRPAETTDAWADLDPAVRRALARDGAAGIRVVEAADEREEALAIAVALREALERPGRTAALITPDRALALRVAAELRRWDIVADDSAGEPLARSPAGRLARLAADVAVLDAKPERVLALLAHPLVRLGLTRAEVERAASALEIGCLRGPAPAKGFSGIAEALSLARTEDRPRDPRPRRRLGAEEWDAAEDLLLRLSVAFRDFVADEDDAPDDLIAVAKRHRAACDLLMAGAEEDEPDADAEPDASVAVLDALFDDMELAEPGLLAGRFSDYPAFFTALARERVVSRRNASPHPRLRILGLLEARLLSVDRVVLGGLDEGVWPPKAETDAFLNRPMRGRVGLAPPERRLGQTAHDFVQALGCPDAIVTRAHKREGAPTVPSRFLQRLRAFSGEERWGELVQGGQRFRALAAAIDAGTAPVPPRLRRPAPRPDPALFPRSLSVTEIETLVRDPYGIFARHVLGLDALEPVAVQPSASDRGTIVHDVLGGFAERFPEALPALDEAEQVLYALAANAFAPISDAYPELYAEWWPRFVRLAEAFLAWEAERRPGLRRVDAETGGRWALDIPGGHVLTLRARADRIETRRDGGHTIIDFKTGQPPSAREVFAGFSPQLTLEAAMLRAGAFKGLPPTAGTPDLLYIRAGGGKTPLDPVPLKAPRGDGRDLPELVEAHVAGLRRLVGAFMAGEASYLSRPYPKYAKAYSDYDHLARVREWSLIDGEE
ncbi:double-strand break repair protein AddB [Methylobacterium platani]|uniref:Double-strand break repair protein AddB n=2 Tax=Methylobacterium platani TaxID=427683 RepID=A0A179SFS4_9HYPH|nr:double-strand break repair protein AddB [Methylobacterium platani]KMO10343.1 double-strand break repair protein AddB [Methylobacterium platani JCM 14648]OAS26445.1 double-strand break repair protein AddB [Methylobacterium platani]